MIRLMVLLTGFFFAHGLNPGFSYMGSWSSHLNLVYINKYKDSKHFQIFKFLNS